jgi:8-oxo-dGTP pyrophosphatase MutT (NUDIX family)
MVKDEQRYVVLARTLIFVFRGDELLLMKYSGKGGHNSKEKTDRKDFYNPIGGHVEAGEDVVESACREAQEEAGIHLHQPKLKGVINVNGFAGKNMIIFVIVATTKDTPLSASLEGELHWVSPADLPKLRLFADVPPIIRQLKALKKDETFVGKAVFEGFELIDLQLRTI